MDPLSVIASALSIGQVLGTGIKTLRSIANTSSEFNDMLNELSSLQAWMNQLRATVDGMAGSRLSVPRDILPRLELLKLELSQIVNATKDIQSRLMGSTGQKPLNKKGEPKVSLINWQRSRGKFVKLKERAKRCREDMSASLDLVGLSQQLQQHQTSMEILTISHTQYSDMQSTLTRFESRFDALETILASTSLEARQDTDPQDAASVNVCPPATRIQVQVPLRNRCARYCRCQCHSKSAFRTPSWSRALIGSLMLQYNGTVRLNTNPCDVPGCRSEPKRRVEVAYSFPTWLLRRAVFLSTSWGSLTDVAVSLQLRVPRISDNSDAIMWAIKYLDVEWLRGMISSRELLPIDVNRSGEGFLNAALRVVCIDLQPPVMLGKDAQMVECFLQMGFCPSYIDQDTGMSGLSYSKRILLMDTQTPFLTPDRRQLLHQILDDAGEELMDVSTMTRDTVLGLGTMALEDALVAEPWCINSLDDTGFSPLHWAARSNMMQEVALLIQHGADIELRERYVGSTPLMFAVGGGYEDLVSFLLENGASIKTTDFEGYGCLHYCVSVNVARILLRAGADPRERQKDRKRTAIHQIARYSDDRPPTHAHLGFFPHQLAPRCGPVPDLPGLISELIQAGADLDAKDINGATPLLVAVVTGNITATWHLYNLGARVDITNNNGWDILSYLARSRGRFLEQIECFRAMKIKGIDPDRKFRPDGDVAWSAAHVFGNRMKSGMPPIPKPTQIEVFAFYALVTEIRHRNWEAGLFLEAKEELEAKGYVNSIRNWLGWQWQMIRDDDEFSGLVWDTRYNIWPEYYREAEDSIDYDTGILWGRIEKVQDDLALSEPPNDGDSDEMEEFFDATE